MKPSNSAYAGKHSYGMHHIKMMWPQADVHIGAFCSFAPEIKFVLGGNHRTDWVTTYPFGHTAKDVFGEQKTPGHPATKGAIVIGNDVYIAFGATIMSGVTVGDGAVIAAHSHVVKDVEPYEMVGGNPARHIKYRFEPEIIELLLKLQWWGLKDKIIKEIMPILMAPPDVEALRDLVTKYA